MDISLFRRLLALACLTVFCLPPAHGLAAKARSRASQTRRKTKAPALKMRPRSLKAHQPPQYVGAARNADPAPILPTSEDLATPISRAYQVSQGNTLHLKIRAPQELATASTIFGGLSHTFSPIPCADRYYECFIPVDCEQAPGDYKVVIKTTTSTGEVKRLGCSVTVNPFSFKQQRGFRVARSKLRQLKRAGAGIGGSRESKLLAKYIKASPKQKWWAGPFRIPINLQYVTSPFGEIRTSHGLGKRHHRGIDMADSPRAPIYAAHHGKIAVKTRTPASGNVIAIDHGLGVFTVYCHMDSFAKNLNIGDMVQQGQQIGRIGMTGYASGHHLHLEMRVNNIAVDFMPWTKEIY